MSKVIRRPGGSTLPPSADAYSEMPPVQVTHRTLARVLVKTFCGVEIKCRITESRSVDDGTIYRVKPVENKWKDFKLAGVPVTEDNAMTEFTAFDWQIAPCRDN